MVVDLDNIFKALRLVPEFDGNANVLTRFIKLCDELVEELVNSEPVNNLNSIALLNGILNKVTGPAARLINAHGIPQDWAGIRSALINNFADQRDETALYNDLALLTQGSSTPQEFYERCQNLFSTIMTYISLHESVATTIESKRSLYQKLTLQAYVRGLKDPLGSRIRCMRPESIEKALEFVHEELNTMYLQNRNEHLTDKKWQTQTPPAQNPKPFLAQPFTMNQSKPFMLNMPGPSRPQWMAQAPPQFKQNFQSIHQQGPSRTQQMFRAPPPNYNAQNNYFRLPPRNPMQHFNQQSPARPMSGVSHFVQKTLPPSSFATGHDWRKFGNPPPTNYFKSREMNFNDCMGYDYDPSYEYQNEYYADYETYEYPGYYCADPEQQNPQHPEINNIPSNEDNPEQLLAIENSNFQSPTNSGKPK